MHPAMSSLVKSLLHLLQHIYAHQKMHSCLPLRSVYCSCIYLLEVGGVCMIATRDTNCDKIHGVNATPKFLRERAHDTESPLKLRNKGPSGAIEG